MNKTYIQHFLYYFYLRKSVYTYIVTVIIRYSLLTNVSKWFKYLETLVKIKKKGATINKTIRH